MDPKWVEISPDTLFLTVFLNFKWLQKNSPESNGHEIVQKTFKIRSPIRQKKNHLDPTPRKQYLTAKWRIRSKKPKIGTEMGLRFHPTHYF